jgi:iron complex outermembrane receptor protein
LHVHGGINNLLDTQYSGLLAYNSSFGSYFNPAPGVNYFAGLGLTQSFGR